jgi:hypothetical protein
MATSALRRRMDSSAVDDEKVIRSLSDRAGRRRRHAPPTSRSRGRLRGSVSLATHPPARLRDLRSEIRSPSSRIGGCFPWSGSLKARVWVSTCTHSFRVGLAVDQAPDHCPEMDTISIAHFPRHWDFELNGITRSDLMINITSVKCEGTRIGNTMCT